MEPKQATLSPIEREESSSEAFASFDTMILEFPLPGAITVPAPPPEPVRPALPKASLPRPDFLKRRQAVNLALFAVVATAAVLSGIITRWDTASSIRAVPRVIAWMARNLIPDAQAVARLPDILRKLGDTLLMSVVATACASAAAILFGIIGSRATRPNKPVAAAARGVASLFRNIPVVAWAMILLISFGQSPFTGFLALFLESFGFLSRTFMETIDETAESSVEALRASGATYLQTVFSAVLPSVMPQIVSWMLYMLDTNVRSATLVGILTGTGIGFAFSLYYNRFNYPAAALCVAGIVTAVLIIETVSNHIRRVIL